MEPRTGVAGKRGLVRTAGVVLMLLGSSVAYADPSGPAQAAQADPGPVPNPTPTPEASAGRDDDLSDVGRKLDDLGISVRAQLIDELAADPVGGVSQGHTNVGQLQFGGTLNLDRILGIGGGRFHFTATRVYGDSLSRNDLGTFTKVQEIYRNPYQIWRMGLFAYEQKLFSGNVDIFVGRLGTTLFYGRLNSTCYFMSNFTCSVPQLLNSSAGFTKATSATWGGNVRVQLPLNGYIQAGAYEVDDYLQDSSGFDWSTSHATGVTVPVEIGFGSLDDKNRRYPGQVKLGGYVSTAPFADPLYNTQGRSLGLYGGQARPSDQTRRGIYLMGEKMIWRPADQAPRSLSVFGGIVEPLEKEEVMDRQLYTGAALRAPFAGRANDVLSAEIGWYQLNRKEQAFLRDARVRAGGSGENDRNQLFMELDYSIDFRGTLRLAPNVQYIVHPDNSMIPSVSVLPKNALVVGVKFSIALAKALRLPVAPALTD